MDTKTLDSRKRREFLGRLSAASAAGVLGLRPGIAAAEPPPETTSINIVYDPASPFLCYGPQYIATEMLKMEGFTDISYAPYSDDEPTDASILGSGRADITADWVASVLTLADQGQPVVALSGMHIGCTEIFAHEGIRSIRDLKGKKFALWTEGSLEQGWLSMLFAYIGLDPKQDIQWEVHPYEEWGELLAAGEVDAVMLWPPDAQVFRNQKIGHVILDTGTDKPWKDYYCCIIAGNRDFVNKNPVATKRAIRAILKATDLCAVEPELAARAVIKNGFPTEYETALQVFSEIPYALWRDYDPQDTFRFYALRMHKLGLIKQSPETLISKCTDWRFLHQLKQEMKA